MDSADRCFNGVMKGLQCVFCPESVFFDKGSTSAKWAANARIVSVVALVAFGFALSVVGAVLDATLVGAPAGLILAGIGAGLLLVGSIVLAPTLYSLDHARLVKF